MPWPRFAAHGQKYATTNSPQKELLYRLFGDKIVSSSVSVSLRQAGRAFTERANRRFERCGSRRALYIFSFLSGCFTQLLFQTAYVEAEPTPPSSDFPEQHLARP